MGELPIRLTWRLSKAAWKVDTRNPDFFVVDDMWNRWSRWNRVEAAPRFVNTNLLNDLVTMVKAYPGWCVYLALERGGLTVFGNRILFEGDLFSGCESVTELGQRCQSVVSS